MLNNKAINRWNLFWLISVPMSIVMVVAMLGTDLSSATGVSHMISFSVRWAVPIIYLVIAISALHTLFPGSLSAWLLRNRKYIGMCFAVAMSWQAFFIFTMSVFYRDYYFEEVYYLRDELEGSTGYIFLAAMVVTSFSWGRRFLNQDQWKLLHRSGIYFLWAYPFSVYWWNLSYYENPVALDYLYYWAGFAAFVLRIAAWSKKRASVDTPVTFKVLGGLLIVFGLVIASTGLQWQDTVTTFLLSPAWSANLVLWLPYWPFEPFLSLFVIGLGATLMTWNTSPRMSEVPG